MSAIYTLTMNPALDVTTAVSEVVPLHKLRCDPEQRFPGGGGLNVARAVNRLGGDAAALFPCGGTTGAELARLLEQAAVSCTPIPIAGESRQNFAVLETVTGKQYRFVLPGPVLSVAECDAVTKTVWSRVSSGDFVVASGSLPRGVAADFLHRQATHALASGVRLVLDTQPEILKQSLAPGVDLIKPSFSEFVALTGVSPLDEAAALGAIRTMIDHNLCRRVALSLGDRGAWFVGRDFAIAAAAPSITPNSTIGAGDSFVAGLILALSRQETPEDSLRCAVAAGAAALLMPGVELCRAEDAARLMPEIVVRSLS